MAKNKPIQRKISERAFPSDKVPGLVMALNGTAKNVYVVCRRDFCKEVDEKIFELLEKNGLFRCPNCNIWMETEHRSNPKDPSGMCERCVRADDDCDEEDEADEEDD